VLEEIEVPQPLGLRVMDRVHTLDTRRPKPATGDKVDADRFLEVRTPRVKLPDGRVVQIEPDWFGKLSGFTLLFEALVLVMAQQMTFAASPGWSTNRGTACTRFVRAMSILPSPADLSAVTAVAIDETSYRRGHNYLTVAADASKRRVVFVTEGRDAKTIARFADHLAEHKGRPAQVCAVSIDMSPAFIKGVADHLPNARVTFDKFHVIAHASAALDQARRLEQRTDPSLKGLRWTLLKDRDRLSAEARADLDGLIAQAASKRTARAWLYREHLRGILERKQINVVTAMQIGAATRITAVSIERLLAEAPRVGDPTP
jgi:transposase